MRAWWDQMDLNQRPSACRADALPLSYGPKMVQGFGIEPNSSALQADAELPN